MAEYQSDRQLQELHDEMYQREAARTETGTKTIDNRSRLLLGLFVGAVLLMVYLEKITMKEGLIVGAIAAIVLYFWLNDKGARKELTWLECQIRIYDLLKFLQDHPIGDYQQIPKGEIRITPIGRKQWYDGQAFKRSFGVNIWNEDIDVEEMYFVEVDVFTGDIITFRHSPEGVRGDETKDIKLLPSQDMLMQKRMGQYFGKIKGQGGWNP
jgi:hypothetical protein